MAPSFDQLDPEQSEYDGEEDVDFSGMCVLWMRVAWAVLM